MAANKEILSFLKGLEVIEMKSKVQRIKDGFLSSLQELRKEGNEFIAFRSDEGVVADGELTGFKKYADAIQFVRSQAAPNKVPVKIEYIDRVMLDVIQGKIKNWKGIKALEPHFIKPTPLNDDRPLLEKKRSQGNSLKI